MSTPNPTSAFQQLGDFVTTDSGFENLGSIILHRLNMDSLALPQINGGFPFRQDLEDPDITDSDLKTLISFPASSTVPTSLEALIDSILINNPLYWENSVNKNYTDDFNLAINTYKKAIVDAIKQGKLDTPQIVDLTSALDALTPIHRMVRDFENTVSFRFKVSDLTRLLTQSHFKDTTLRENDIIEFSIKRSGEQNQRIFLGFITAIRKTKSYGNTISLDVTCYGLSKILGLTRVITDPAISSQFESGSAEIDQTNFAPYENALAGKSIQEIFDYIMTNVLALKSVAFSTNPGLQNSVQLVNAHLQTERTIKRLQQDQVALFFTPLGKKYLKQSYIDAILGTINVTGTINEITNSFKLKNDAVDSNTKLTDDQKVVAHRQLDIEMKLAEAKVKRFDFNSSTPKSNNKSIVAGLRDRESFLQLFPSGDPENPPLIASNFTQVKLELEKYLTIESQIRLEIVTELEQELKVSSLSVSDLQSIKRTYTFNKEFFTELANFRTAYQILYLLLLIRGTEDPIAILGGGGNFFAYNNSWRKGGFNTFYSQLDYAVGPLNNIKTYGFYDCFENEANQIICRPPKFNKFDYTNIGEFVISRDQIITNSTSRDDLTLETRIDHTWHIIHSGDLPFHGGHYTDMGILTKYGMRAESPKQNPNAISPRIATLFSALALSNQNAQTRPSTLTVINDREYHLGNLYFISDLFNTSEILDSTGKNFNPEPPLKRGKITEDGTVPPNTISGVVGYLVDYTTSITHGTGSVLTHSLTFSYVRLASVVVLPEPLKKIQIVDKNDNIVSIDLDRFLNFRRLPDLDTVIQLIEKDQTIIENQFVGTKTTQDRLAKAVTNTRQKAAEDPSGFYIARPRVDPRSLAENNTLFLSLPHEIINTVSSVGPSLFTPSNGNFQETSVFQKGNFGSGTISQSLIDLLFVLDFALKQSVTQSDFITELLPLIYPGGSTVHINSPTKVTILEGFQLPIGPGVSLPIHPLSSVTITLTDTSVFTVPSTSSLDLNSDTTYTSPFSLFTLSDPNVSFIGLGGTKYIATKFILFLTSPPFSITLQSLPLQFTIESLIDSGSIIVGSLTDPELKQRLGVDSDSTRSSHFYGASVDISLVPWGTQSKGFLEPNPTFLSRFETLLSRTFGEPTTILPGNNKTGWFKNTITGPTPIIANGSVVPDSSLLMTRYHLQVPFELLFPGGT